MQSGRYEFTKRQVGLAFLVPVIIIYLIFYVISGLLFQFPFQHNIGDEIVKIRVEDQLVVLTYVIVFLAILSAPIYFVNVKRLRLEKQALLEEDSSKLSLYFFISVLSFFAAAVNGVFQAPVAVENLLRMVSLLSLFVISFGFAILKNGAKKQIRLFVIIAIFSNVIAFAIIPIMSGFIQKGLLLIGALIFTLVLEDNAKRRSLILYFIGAFAIVLIGIQSIKGVYREYFFGSHYHKIMLNMSQGRPLLKKNDQCDEKIDLRITSKQERVANTTEGKDTEKLLDLYESGHVVISLQEVNELIRKKYDNAQLIYGLPSFGASITRAIAEKNDALLLGLARGWGKSVPKDGSRAARLFALASETLPVSRAYLGLLEIEGNGIELNVSHGISCVLHHGGEDEIRFMVRKERGEMGWMIDSELNNPNTTLPVESLKKIVQHERSKNKELLFRSVNQKYRKNHDKEKLLDLYEMGHAALPLTKANDLIKEKYQQSLLANELSVFKDSTKRAIAEKNYALLLGLARGWGNSVPRDGGRAAVLFAHASETLPVSLAYLGLLEIEGNGVVSNVVRGVSLVLHFGGEDEIRFMVRNEKGEVGRIVDSELNNLKTTFPVEWLKKIVQDERLKKKKLFSELVKQNALSGSNVHAYLKPELQQLDKVIGYSLSRGVDRVDQMRNLVLIDHKILTGKEYFGVGVYSPILWSWIPRIIFPDKPIDNDEIGLKIGKLFNLYDAKDPQLSWALPTVSESLLVGGRWGFFWVTVGLSIVYFVYVLLAVKSTINLYLYGNVGLANMLMTLTSGFVGSMSGMIQCLIMLVVGSWLVKMWAGKQVTI